MKIWQIEGANKWNLPVAFLLKSLIGLYFLFIYTEFYGHGTLSADAGAFMQESKVLNDVFFISPIDYLKFLTGIGDNHDLQLHYLSETSHWDAGAQAILNDNKNIVRIHSLIHFFSFNNSVIHMLIMCVISLAGVKNMLIGLKDRSKLNPNLQFWILVLIPSVLFWTSGLLKEPLLFLGIGILIRGVMAKESPRKKAIYTLLGLLLLTGFKPYVFIALMPVIIFIGVYKILPKMKVVGALLILGILGTSSLMIFPNQTDHLVHRITRKQQDFRSIGKGGVYAWVGNGFYYFDASQVKDLTIEKAEVKVNKSVKAVFVNVGGIESPTPITLHKTGTKWPIYFMREESNGYIEIGQIDNSISKLLINTPNAIVNSLFRPFIGDPGSWLKYPAILEVWMVFLFLIYAIIKRRKLNKEEQLILISLLIFIVLLSAIIGLITPVLGAIVRYRIPVYIAVVIIGIVIIDPKKKLKQKNG